MTCCCFCCSPRKTVSAVILARFKKRNVTQEVKVEEGKGRCSSECQSAEVVNGTQAQRGRWKVLGWGWQAAAEQRGGCRAKTKTYQLRAPLSSAALARHPRRPLPVEVARLHRHFQARDGDITWRTASFWETTAGTGLEGWHCFNGHVVFFYLVNVFESKTAWPLHSLIST